ncbi:MAG: hypothetical protein QXF25_01515 [Candidatus Pacearchaeota archaeon]
MIRTYTNVLCLECGEEIFNPLCPKCLAREIEVWLESHSSKIKTIVKNEIKKILKFNKEHNHTKCILCKKKDVFLCPYCFTERIYNKLKNAKVNSKILNNFLTLFNFDLEHTGYSKDLAKFDDSENFDDFGYDNGLVM